MSGAMIRAVVVDDERPARAFLTSIVRARSDVAIVGEAANGIDAVRLIEDQQPDLALLDLQMPELDGLGVVRLLKRRHLPLVIFVTAYEEYALRAFDVNAVDYLLKPVSHERLAEALQRVHERLDRADLRATAATKLKAAVADYEREAKPEYLERIPVRKRDEIALVPVRQIAMFVADGELIHLTTIKGERHTITFRLKDLETRLDPSRFIRLGRGTLAAIDLITKVHPMPGGVHIVTLATGQALQVSRIQSRVLRERLLKF